MFFLRSFTFVLLMCSSFLVNATGGLAEPKFSIGIDETDSIADIGSDPDVWTFTIPDEILSGSIFFTPDEDIENFEVISLTNLIDLLPGDYTFTVNGKNGGYTVETVSKVPVPAAAWLMGTGLVGLISFGRRKATVIA